MLKLGFNSSTENSHNDINQSIEYLCNYIDECWKARQHYKDERNKLFYWVASLFALIAGATGILGAIHQSGAQVSFTIMHIIIFDALFLICWYYYLYKELNAAMYGEIGMAGEEVIMEICNIKLGEVPAFFKIKGHYFGKHDSKICANHLLLISNFLIMLVCIGVVTSPIWNRLIIGKVAEFKYETVVSSLVLFLLVGLGKYIYSTQEKKILSKIREEWAILKKSYLVLRQP